MDGEIHEPNMTRKFSERISRFFSAHEISWLFVPICAAFINGACIYKPIYLVDGQAADSDKD